MQFDLVVLVVVLALGIDAAFGYPDALFRRVGHPVTWIGWLIATLDEGLNRETWSLATRRVAGIGALIVLLAVCVFAALAVQALLGATWPGLIGVAIVASTLIASRSLYNYVREVAVALEAGGLTAGRRAVSRIVGRDPETLDEHGVARAAIESLAENVSDGVVAPVFWFLVLGLPGLVAYKAINTADSMIGHRTERHEAFGWASARLDDLVNLPASRLTALLFALAAAVHPGASPRSALAAMMRDAHKHRSPNAGWPESSVAGALGLKLNGPKYYGDQRTDDAYMGDGNADATPGDIRRALRLATIAWGLTVALLTLISFNVRG